jgi:vancomycin resistance protein YoaR
MIVVQSLIAMAAGIAVLFDASIKEMPANVYAGDIHIGGKSYAEAIAAIEAEYSARFGGKKLQLTAGGEEIYEIPFSSIEAYADGEATLGSIKTVKGIGDIPRLINTYFGQDRTDIRPVVRFNESKLRMELDLLSKMINTNPVDAAIYYKDGIIEKVPDTPGITLDVNAAVSLIEKALAQDPFQTISLSSGNALKVTDAPVTMKDFDDIEIIHGEYTTSIKDATLYESIQFAVDQINGTILAPAGDKGGKDGFSFAESLGLTDGSEHENEGYDQTASTLYTALLTAGLPKDSITRLPHKTTVGYIQPGLDAWISGNAGDVKFRNPYGKKLAVFAVRNGSVLTAVIAGSREDKAEKSVIRTETVQESDPPVYYVEKDDLKPGEKVVLNPGKKGLAVKVYRNDELIGLDQYEAETSIVQIAPDIEVPEYENK